MKLAKQNNIIVVSALMMMMVMLEVAGLEQPCSTMPTDCMGPVRGLLLCHHLPPLIPVILLVVAVATSTT